MIGPLRKWEHTFVLGIVYGVAPGILLSIAVCVAFVVVK